MTEHARFAPSGAHRWLRCLGSVDLEAQFPDTSSAYAEEGTEAHKMLSDMLSFSKPGPGKDADPEMVEFITKVADDILKAAEGKTMLLDQRIDTSEFVGAPDQHGTGDVVIFDADMLEIHDLKYGMGVPVVAYENEQLGIYGGGALKQYDVFGDFKKVKLVIHMPRLEYVSEWEVDIEKLNFFGETVRTATKRIREGNAPFNPGEKQCRFCKAKHSCEALKMSVYETVGAGFDDMTQEPMATPEKLRATLGNISREYETEYDGRMYTICTSCGAQDDQPHKENCAWPTIDAFLSPPVASPMVLDNPRTVDAAGLSSRMSLVGLVEDWCKAVRAAVEIELLAGRPVEGWKLVEGRMGNRAWADEKAIEKTLKGMRLKKEEMYKFKLISPTDAEKLAKKKVIGDAQWEKLQKQITRSPGAPSVAPAASERSAIKLTAVADDFDVVDETKA